MNHLHRFSLAIRFLPGAAGNGIDQGDDFGIDKMEIRHVKHRVFDRLEDILGGCVRKKLVQIGSQPITAISRRVAAPAVCSTDQFFALFYNLTALDGEVGIAAADQP
nr:hypothetical protein [Geotalea toluenoxydans]